MYATQHDPKIYPHTKFRIPTSNYIQRCSELDLARTETRSQGHSDMETVGDPPGPKMYLHLCAKLKFTNSKKCLNLWEI